jgi:hypothetical protein
LSSELQVWLRRSNLMPTRDINFGMLRVLLQAEDQIRYSVPLPIHVGVADLIDILALKPFLKETQTQVNS